MHLKNFFSLSLNTPDLEPPTQEQVERFNQTLSRYLQKHIFEEEFGCDVEIKHWLKHLDAVMCNYNSARHSATGKTPFRLVMGICVFNTVLYLRNSICLVIIFKNVETLLVKGI
ncbi:Transposon Tf2-9 polyprotein [Nosema granulosis]|uniref:Transposon Tf2-9 polyprotein n=1 Tax=Nosema granulosis TaxID=83296 RepID=A0A9P6KYN4_9MICR|nr:Transposon Tf2-9 polyprotein [Nosema granulosis]